MGLAFFEGDLNAVGELRDQVLAEGAAKWQLKTTIDDLAAIVAQTQDVTVRDGLQLAFDRLTSLSAAP